MSDTELRAIPDTAAPTPASGERLLLVTAGTAVGDEAAAGQALLDAGLPVAAVNDPDTLVEEVRRGAGAVFVGTSSFDARRLHRLRDTIDDTPGFESLQFFLLAGAPGDGESVLDALDELSALPNVTVFDTTPSPHTLLATARGALREQNRQVYVRQLLGRIEEAEEREERLLATLGHELRNPLGVITTALSVIRRLEGDDAPTARHRQMIERQVQSLTERIDELLAGAFDPNRPPTREWPPPRAVREAPSSASSTAEATPVLIVEDDDDGRSALAELLTIWGYRAITAPDGETALEEARRAQPSIALIDIGLPGIDGYEVARQLRRERDHEITLIAMTGYGQPEDRRRAMSAGFDRHLVKPVDARRLAELLAERLHRTAGVGAA